MSRVGQTPITIPEGVTVDLKETSIETKGPNGSLSMLLNSEVAVKKEENTITVSPASKSKKAQALWGTMRNQINNLVEGVHKGFYVNLEIQGVGYRAAVQDNELVLQLGYSHEIRHQIPEGITVKCAKPTEISITGADRQKVGQVAAEVRAYRPPEPYKGKGIRREGEYVLRKEGKKK